MWSKVLLAFLAFLAGNGNASLHLRKAVRISGDWFLVWFNQFAFLRFATALVVQADRLLSQIYPRDSWLGVCLPRVTHGHPHSSMDPTTTPSSGLFFAQSTAQVMQ